MGLLDCIFCDRKKTKRQSKADTILSAGKTTSSEEKNDPERERVARGWESDPEDEEIARRIKESTQRASASEPAGAHIDDDELIPDGMGYRYKVSALAT